MALSCVQKTFLNVSSYYALIVLSLAVRTPVSANPGLNFNPGFYLVSSKALSRIIFYIFLEYPIIKL